ncbi:sodium-dependent bicarbonate transport family permease [Undibacterium sp. RTI2.1]|uniref:sodium-dependent bicarbonate transport family permease n=1 Tax=unclassified Undibacterium TaxID=2630295 RepID=UPI002AB4FF15|nr:MULTISPECIES: sodium-dependent bicarbonate transport family permease [unclassified Undibacterium]MDY7539187.1 sodium-dependent bicarbonate transport family permease [Undibacterium sp. 5I1]MEB0031039.1 sodium-dependent bicarbonate transport family permease [Undibacterium sp. RTI2.1]MEB0116274.1 sodium-dependent bicarbonate transport family permease [Undibacterium sp. RTI2.2]MEB0231142.1 sodium-dependent bicarbonate transport family permease [Undibacterium sp. 10I3]MEB0257015.1 sodium-depende
MQSILDPAILFFAFGIFAGMIKSNLDIPPQLSRFLSLYLLMALGLKGGFALAHSGLTPQIVSSLGCAILLAVLVPALGYQLLKRFINHYDAAAIAATYGSVSAVTFITAVQYLENHHLAYGGHMAAAMALMESPAIIMAVIFANTLRKKSASGSPHPTSLSKVLHESLTDGAQLLLLGSMVVGIISGESGKAAMRPFSGDLFKGMLAFFLLDMGLMAARKLPEIKGQSPWIIAYAIVTPLCHAALALGLACLLKLPAGDASLLMVLAASASYIAVPAVLRYTIPEANPSLYLGMSLGITFPLNIFLGIPLYIAIAHQVIGVG